MANDLGPEPKRPIPESDADRDAREDKEETQREDDEEIGGDAGTA